MTVPLIRKRAKRPKVKTGCRTCRARHVKCGEEWPVCHRCTKAGRECEGYDAPTKKDQMKAPLQHLLPNGRTPDENWLVPRSLSSSPQALSTLEGYTLDYFRLQAMRDLPGSIWLLSWDKLILPFCRSEPALLHAATAIGSLQRAVESRASHCPLLANDSEHDELALAQYSKSISSVRADIEALDSSCKPHAIETILTTCLLLFCFEVLRGEDAAAAMHLRNGLRLLSRHLDAPSIISPYRGVSRQVELSVSPHTRIEILTQTFVRLDADLTLFDCYDAYFYPICRQPIPNSIQTLEEAMVHLDALERESHSIGRMVDDLAEQELILNSPKFSLLDRDAQDLWTIAVSRRVSLESSPWISARIEKEKQDLETLRFALNTLPTPTTPDPRRMLMDIHFFREWFTIHTFRDFNEMDCDRFDDEVKQILDTVEQYCTAQSTSNLNHSFRPAFTLGTSVTSVACIIGEKSRNSLIRRRAIAALRSMHLSGAYDCEFMASYLECVMETEERLAREMLGLPDNHLFLWNEIPAEARFFDSDCGAVNSFDEQYYKADVGRLMYLRAKGGKDGELEFGETIFPVRRHVTK